MVEVPRPNDSLLVTAGNSCRALHRAELYTVHCKLYTIHHTLYTVHCTLFTVNCKQLNVYGKP